MTGAVSTIVAFATPISESAVAVLRLSGPLSEEIAISTFSRKSPPVPRLSSFGKYTSITGEKIDECLYVFFKGKASYTGEDSLEISCHGNPFIAQKILSDIIARGCRLAEPGEFTRRAFLNGKMDLTQAEAVSDIITARSKRSLEAAQKLHDGLLGKKVSAWNDAIMSLLAELESQIDFSDEEVPDFNRDHFIATVRVLVTELESVANTAKYAMAVREGVNVVIFGAPNAGKSSLLNMLLGENRALVSSEAGTTRDFISENITLGDYRIRIMDTAGIRNYAESSVEKLGIERAKDCIRNADFYLYVVDASSPLEEMSTDVATKINIDNTVVIFNKNDLPKAFDTENFLPGFERISVSLLDNSSAKPLKNKILSSLETKKIVPAADVLIVGARHAELLSAAGASLEEAISMLKDLPIEFAASRMRSAMTELNEILGNFDNEKVLDKVFSGFCIGK